ncbi:MAG: PEP-CTERM sorting domain-containing protein [Opitutae bacterium]|nr:PEP-CTERM sorting domain-containing protein [Opitutae bacterium]
MSPVSFLRRALALCAACLAISSSAQISLSGTSYTEDFNSLSSGLPSGWSVYTSATSSSYGTSAAFTSAATAWNSATAGTFFRNIASNDIASNASTSTQSSDLNRALGWKPLTAASRDGGIVFELANTSGYGNFSLSVDLFTGNNAGTTNQTYTLEYRIGSSGSFTSLGAYSSTTPLGSITLTVDSTTLSSINNQSSSVAFRFRNASGASDSTYDTLGIDNFSLNYSAIPEPSTYVAIAGVFALAGVAWKRRKQRGAAPLL